MAQKNFVQNYTSPTLRKLAHRWQIEWQEKNELGKLIRCRVTGNINRIKNKRERTAAAAALIEEIKQELAEKYAPPPPKRAKNAPTIYKVFGDCVERKLQTDRNETRRTYASFGRIFMEWLQAEKLDTLPPDGFTRKHAIAFLDYVLLVRKTRTGARLSNVTWNKYRLTLATFFNDLERRELILKNPFSRLPSRRNETPKNNRIITPTERAALLGWAYANDYWLFVFCVLEYLCFIRGTECTRLTFANFDLPGGMIHLSEHQTKNRKAGVVTIPADILPYFLEKRFVENPVNFFVLGGKLQPGKKAVHRNYLANRHRKMVDACAAAGLIEETEGLTPYRWKYTGITEALQTMQLMAVVQQARHYDPKQTMAYNRPSGKNTEFERKKNDLF